MILQRHSPGIWGLTQDSDPALDFILHIPEYFAAATSTAAPPGDPFFPLACFQRGGQPDLSITVAVMFLPRHARARDLLEGVLELSPVTSVAWKPADLHGDEEADAFATLPSVSEPRYQRIKVLTNGRYAFRVESSIIGEIDAATRLEVASILESPRFRVKVPWPVPAKQQVDSRTGAAFAYPEEWRISKSDTTDPRCSEYILAASELGCLTRIVAVSGEVPPFRLATNFAEWFRLSGAVLKGAPIIADQPSADWPAKFHYAPQATLNGASATTGVSILVKEGMSISVGLIGPSRKASPWKYAMMRSAVDALLESVRC